MALRKTSKKIFTTEIIKYITIILFIFFWTLVIITDPITTFWGLIKDSFEYLFWIYYKWIFPPIIFILSFFLIKEKDLKFNLYRFFWLIFYLSSVTTIIWYFLKNYNRDTWYNVIFNFYPIFENNIWAGATAFSFFILFILSLIILFRFNPIDFILKIFSFILSISDIKSKLPKTKLLNKKENSLEKKKKDLDQMMINLKQEKLELVKSKELKQLSLKNTSKNIKIHKNKSSIIWWLFKKDNNIDSEKKEINRNPEFKNWKFPWLDLLYERWWNIEYNENEIRKKEIEIQEKLLQFKIEVDMIGYKVWPTVIQFRLKPKAWVALKKIKWLKQDLILALHAKNIRIQAPIPWFWAVWIEVPNDNRQSVWLKEVISSKKFNSKTIEIPIAIWKNVSWDIVVWDLCKMPHLLVAWQTGSGKSVWMNWFLISMLYKFSPSELKMIMIDPKRVELSIYNWIPHLLTPVIINPDKALNALKWCIAEMLRRYDLATKVWARNLKEYNQRIEKNKNLPYIVIVVDELADLMLSWNKKEVEQSISRIAQMARAVWIHLIIATQRPSVDVITWLIKANIPSRIAFTVASHIDSQTVLWKKWSEDLLGSWDMLYYPTWLTSPERVQWVLVETNEVEAVVNKLKLTVDPEMINNLQIPEIVNPKSKLAWSILENYKWDQDEQPEIIEKALKLVKESKKGSSSLIQRKLWLWYARAAKILDILEELWVVGPSNWSKPREVYVD